MDISTIPSILGSMKTNLHENVTSPAENTQATMFKEILSKVQSSDNSSSVNNESLPNKIDGIDTNISNNVNKIAINNLSPSQLLEMQINISNISTEINLAAKTAGSISQGINKLVSMQ